MIDVNEQFRVERARQMQNADDRKTWVAREVAAGRMRDMGNGRYHVTEGFDRGETIQLTSSGEILLQHGLDMSTGKAALYTRVPAWHSLGTVIPEGVSDIDTVMELGGLNYLVSKRPDTYRNIVTGEQEVMEGKYKVFREDTGKAVGRVGSVYEPLQNRQSFEFLEALVGKFGVVWECAGALRDGARTFVMMRLPEPIVIDKDGVADQIVPYLGALNSHDGSGQFECIASPWRIECGNTERAAVRDALVRWGTRHTSNVADKVAEARYTFAQSVKYFEEFTREQELLARTTFRDAELETLVNEIWKEINEDSTDRARAGRRKLMETLEPIHAANVATLGQTAYAAERTMTEWADWKRDLKPRSESLKGNMAAARATAVLEGTADAFKTKAHRQLLLRANR